MDIVSFVSNLSAVELSYLFVVLFMFTLAIIDLTVGVSNDAVNFLSSAVGSKAAKVKHVLIVAAVGVFIGAAFSSGMMDVARHGIFDPSHFSFADVMCIYLAVVISMNLGVMNLLPLPALDGGRLLFLLIELLIGRPVNKNVEGYIHFAGMLLLFLLMIVVCCKDIIGLFSS